MCQAQEPGPETIQMPFLIHCPPEKGRKPTSIPDTTQFFRITELLFGVSCATPEQAYYTGTYNELYLLHLCVPNHLRGQIPSKVLARVSTDEKTRSDMSLESEIATMVYVRSKTAIPVPIVYGYCPTRENVIGQPFSIISYAEGGSNMNSSLWENLSLDIKLNTIREYAKIILELSKLKFDYIGSLYFKPGLFPPSYQIGPIAWCKHESGPRMKNGYYDRGPWKAPGGWLRAALADEIAFMEKIPQLAQSTHKCRRDDDTRWRLAQQVLPKLWDRVADIIEDPLDRCGAGPFVLAHMDFSPRNIIFAPEGVDAGRILCVVDWEMSSTVPLWALVCYPSWFGQICQSSSNHRGLKETQLFKDTYIRELQRLTREPLILTVVQNPRSETKRRFADVATLPWTRAHSMAAWMKENSTKRC